MYDDIFGGARTHHKTSYSFVFPKTSHKPKTFVKRKHFRTKYSHGIYLVPEVPGTAVSTRMILILLHEHDEHEYQIYLQSSTEYTVYGRWYDLHFFSTPSKSIIISYFVFLLAYGVEQQQWCLCGHLVLIRHVMCNMHSSACPNIAVHSSIIRYDTTPSCSKQDSRYRLRDKALL